LVRGSITASRPTPRANSRENAKRRHGPERNGGRLNAERGAGS
jgi:hypothetical protein